MAIRKGSRGAKEEGGSKASKGEGARIRTINKLGGVNRSPLAPKSPKAPQVPFK